MGGGREKTAGGKLVRPEGKGEYVLGKVRRIWGKRGHMGGGGGGGGGAFAWTKRRGSSSRRFGLVGEQSEVLARMVGDGVRKMMKKERRGKGKRKCRGVPVCLYVITTLT